MNTDGAERARIKAIADEAAALSEKIRSGGRLMAAELIELVTRMTRLDSACESAESEDRDVRLAIRRIQVVSRQLSRLPQQHNGREIAAIEIGDEDARDLEHGAEKLRESIGERPSDKGLRKIATGGSRHVKVNVKTWTVSIDGAEHQLNSEQTARWVNVLAKNRGKLISAPELKGFDKELIDVRTDRLLKALPYAVQQLLEVVPKKGTRMKMA
jgi:hypothetical protein